MTESNFTPWRAEGARDAASLDAELARAADPRAPGATDDDVLVEVLLRGAGGEFELPLSARVEARVVAGCPVFAASSGDRPAEVFVCARGPVSRELFRALADLGARRVVALDAAFGGDDALKTNAALDCAARGVALRFA